MRHLLLISSAVALVLSLPTLCPAVTENELGVAAQGGYQVLLGEIADILDDGPCFGANFSYGLNRWFGITADGVYGIHQESDEESSGEIDFTLLTVLFGPRFTLELGPVFPYAEALVGATVWRYEVKYDQADGSQFKDDDQRGHASFGGGVGFDAALSDSFQIGLCARYVHAIDGIDLPASDEKLEDEPFGTVQLLLRAGLIF